MISPIKIWRRQKEIRKILGKTGTVVSFTVIYAPPTSFKQYAPYTVVLVKLEAGEEVFGQLVDFDKENFKIGVKVIAILRKVREVSSDDVIPYGIKFRMVEY